MTRRATGSAFSEAKTRGSTFKVDATSVARLDTLAGAYESQELGPLRVRRENGEYRAEFESWCSGLGVEEQPNGEVLMVLTGAPFGGGRLRLPVADEGRTLVLDGGQNVYRFVKR